MSVTSTAYFIKKGMKEFLVCPVRLLRIRMTGD